MKYTFSKEKNDLFYPQYEVDFSVKYFNKLTKKDKEKIYRVIRIIDTLGDDKFEETSDRDYRFRTDQDNSDVLSGVIKNCKGTKKPIRAHIVKNKRAKNMFERLGLKK